MYVPSYATSPKPSRSPQDPSVLFTTRGRLVKTGNRTFHPEVRPDAPKGVSRTPDP